MKTRFESTVIAGLTAFAAAAEFPTLGAETISGEASNAARLKRLSLEDLMNTEVTSVSRSASTVGESPAAVFVITPEIIRRSGATSIPELLRMVPGVNVARLTSNQWVISIRGFDNTLANKLLVQMDGRTLYSPVQSGVFWGSVDCPLEDIERIEVVRGPGGTAWGANAVNGVINIITKSAQETHGGLVSGGGGSEERGFATFRFGGQLGDNLHYRVYGKWFERDSGFSIQNFANANLAHDDWRAGRTGFRLDWTPTTSDTGTLQGDWFSVTSGRASFAPLTGQAIASDTESRGVNVLARWTHTLGKDSSWQLQAYYDRFQQIAGNGGLKFAVDTFDVDFQHQFPIGEQQKVVYGFEFRFQEVLVHGLAGGDPPAQMILPRIDDQPTVVSAFIEDEIKLIPDRLVLSLGSKFEYNSFTGFEYQPSVRLLWTLSKRHSIWASASRAVRTPDILEDSFALVATPVSLVPNRDLDAEEVIAYELGYRAQATDRLSFDTALFYNRYDHLSVINNLPAPPGSFIGPLQFTNGMDGEIYGVEIAATWNPTDWWKLHGAYSYLKLNLHADRKLGTALQSSAELPEKQSPQNHFYVRSSFDMPAQFELDVIVRYVDNLSGFVPSVKSYTTLDVRLGWKPRENLELAVVGQNLLDEHHPENGGGIPVEVERGIYGMATWKF